MKTSSFLKKSLITVVPCITLLASLSSEAMADSGFQCPSGRPRIEFSCGYGLDYYRHPDAVNEHCSATIKFTADQPRRGAELREFNVEDKIVGCNMKNAIAFGGLGPRCYKQFCGPTGKLPYKVIPTKRIMKGCSINRRYGTLFLTETQPTQSTTLLINPDYLLHNAAANHDFSCPN